MCEDHYEFPISSMAPPTCNNGTWSTIPRCIPARCKGLPKPPKFGMVLAPKTEHGMKARFKCKDGFNLTGPGGKEITNLTEYVLTCSFGNWTGETPMCQEVYCSFPGYIPHGKILLVGNMGLYDYRPYVKKVSLKGFCSCVNWVHLLRLTFPAYTFNSFQDQHNYISRKKYARPIV